MHIASAILKVFIGQLTFAIGSKAINLNSRMANDPGNAYRSYQTSIYCNASFPIQHPKTAFEIQNIIQIARKTGQTVKAIGSRHSITDVICTDGIPISMENINHAILNDDGTATFGSGIELQDAMIFLEESNRSLIHIPAFGGITLGGAIGTGAHGSSLKHPATISDQIVSLKIIDGLGSIRTITDPSGLNAFRVNLGLLGIVIDVTLKTVPLFKMTVENKPHPDSILFDGTAVKWAKEYDWFEMFWFPSFEQVVVSKGYYTDLSVAGNASTNLIPDSDPQLIVGTATTFEALQMTPIKPAFYAFEAFTKLSLFETTYGKPPVFTENTDSIVSSKVAKNPATGFAWRLQANRCTKCAWGNGEGKSVFPEESSMGFEFTEDRFKAVLQMMNNVLRQYPASFYLIGAFIRFSKASDSFIAMNGGRTTFSVEWAFPMRKDRYNTPREGLGAMQAILQNMVENFGGRAHFGKNGLYFHSVENIRKSRPGIFKFIEAMKKYDPDGIFLNKFGRRVLAISNKMDIDPKVTHCALQDYCICSSSKDCANLQQCAKLNGFPVCKDNFYVRLPQPAEKFRKFRNLTSILTKYRKDIFHLTKNNLA